MKKILLAGILTFFSVYSYTQDLNGYWKGEVNVAPGGCFPVYNVEFQIKQTANNITGTSYHFSSKQNYIKEEFIGVVSADKIHIQETKIDIFQIPPDCIPCLKEFILTYQKEGSRELLTGSWSGKRLDNNQACTPGNITLYKSNQSDFDTLPPLLSERKAKIENIIYVDTGTIKIDFYDNGQIDGDSISVYVDNEPLIKNSLLTTKALTTSIKIEPHHKERLLVMVGESMGTIPPNTALMVFTVKGKRHQLLLSSDEKNNAAVKFIYVPEKAGK